ncbi:Ring finger domain containing protein, putative [Angomonas deanei]|uniref:RING-type E3 ubiquitin transferase n=1 Tax=Angomonas deanei TaxID=59799 RepID=A0A7G2CS73_9TRYP|nr:Ring finger domain containing protein, putative [Angomonas deanei]
MPPKIVRPPAKKLDALLPKSFFCQHCLHCSYFGFGKRDAAAPARLPCPSCNSFNVFVPSTRDELMHAYESAAINQGKKPSVQHLQALIDLHLRAGGRVVMFRGTGGRAVPARGSRTSTTTTTTTASNNTSRRSSGVLSRPTSASRSRQSSVSAAASRRSSGASPQPPPLPTYNSSLSSSRRGSGVLTTPRRTSTASTSGAPVPPARRLSHAQTPPAVARRPSSSFGKVPTAPARRPSSSSGKAPVAQRRTSNTSTTTPVARPSGGATLPPVTQNRASTSSAASTPTARRPTPEALLQSLHHFPHGVLAGGVYSDLDTVCCICFDDCSVNCRTEVVKLGCDHFFHLACIKPWLYGMNYTCPMCRAAITG